MKEKLLALKKSLREYGYLEDRFSSCSKIYKMTTENISEFVDNVDCRIKDVLTVAASGDQAFNAILNGAKNVTCFDINPFSFCHVKLKEAAIKTLSYEEFLNFFDVMNSNKGYYIFLDRELFNRLKSKLDDETIEFFENLYTFFEDDNYKILKSIYHLFTYHIKHMKIMCSYLEEDNYYKLANILNSNSVSINFIETNFVDLSKKIGNKKFDLILLSNISDYIDTLYKEDPLENFYNDIMNLTNNLNENGVIQVGYTYITPDFIKMSGPFSDTKTRETVFSPDVFNTTYVTAYKDIEPYQYQDKVISYKKVNRG